MDNDPADWQERLAHKARLRARAGLRRQLRSRGTGDVVVDLAGNDYLGLSKHPAVISAAARALSGYGLGATRSRLVRGSTDLHAALESGLADLLRLAELHAVCRRYGALLLVDDAHAVGVRGPAGAGAVAEAGLSGQPDVVVTATLSKSFGAAGGVVAGPSALIAHLVDTGRTFIYDTALPPAVAAGALAALDLIRSADEARAELHERAALIAKRLPTVSPPDGGVVSVLAPGPDEAVAWAARCLAQGVAVGCFRPPSTPDGRSRLRLTVNAGIPRADFERALDVIAEDM